MKRQFSALSVFALVLGALATQSCEFTDGQNLYYNRGHSGYYRDGRYADDNGYYQERYYVHDDYQSNRPGIDVHF
jgi:hypothetical protein